MMRNKVISVRMSCSMEAYHYGVEKPQDRNNIKNVYMNRECVKYEMAVVQTTRYGLEVNLY
jgi:hypothetical protein